MRLALVVHPDRAEAAEMAADLVAAASARDIEVTAEPDDAARISGTSSRPVGVAGDADAIVAIGGDGTVLQAVRRSLVERLPIIGVNAGQVGFLTEVDPTGIADALDDLVAGRFTISERTIVDALLPDGTAASGLNDVVIEKTVSQHVLRLSVWVGEELLTRYRADAVIVATPTGSTAYTYSAGGPLLDPELDALVVTAVAPHTLFSRPIVFRPDVRLRLVVEADRPARVNVDGRSVAELEPGDEVLVVRSAATARFIQLRPRNFVRAVRDKFHLHDG